MPARYRAAFVAMALTLASPALPVLAAEGGGWIGTWAASPQPIWEPDFLAPISFPRNLWNQTIREVARVSLGGSQVRVVLTNEYGSLPLVVSEAHVAISDGEAKIKDGSDRKLTFSGSSSITIPPGAPAVSDPVDLEVAPLGSVAVSLYFARCLADDHDALRWPPDRLHRRGQQDRRAGRQSGLHHDVGAALPERHHGQRAGGCARRRHLRGFDHRRRRLDRRRQSSLAGHSGRAAAGGGRHLRHRC